MPELKKQLRHVRADTASDDRNRPNGQIELAGIAAWLKSGELIGATLTPTEARDLAEQLLAAARRAEGRGRASSL